MRILPFVNASFAQGNSIYSKLPKSSLHKLRIWEMRQGGLMIKKSHKPQLNRAIKKTAVDSGCFFAVFC